jgi:hypothetical protein
MFSFFRRNPETTSQTIASLASKGLSKGKSALTDKEFRRVCASALTQAANKG